MKLRFLTDPRFSPDPGRFLYPIVLDEAVAAHHNWWAGRYRRAAQRPWESVPPEPPLPAWETHRRRLVTAVVAKAITLEIKDLSLRNAGVTDVLLERIGRYRQLRSLDIAGNPITDAGLVHLKGLVNLSRLGLSETPLTDAGLAHLTGLSGLKSLDLYRTRITRGGLLSITKALPRTEVSTSPDL
jgi:hypothetical protein